MTHKVNTPHPESSEPVTSPPFTTRVTLDDALTAVRKAVDEKGADYVYGAEHDFCIYAEQVEGVAQPRCIVGHALAYLGVPLSFLANPELIHITARGLPGELAKIGYRVEPEAIGVLDQAQNVQDQSVSMKNNDEREEAWREQTWGAALAAAENAAGAR
jgi:hypothetical protein